MSKIPMWRRYVRFWGPDPKADVNDEIRFHLEMRTKELVEDGWSPVEARNEARRQFGDLSHVRSECHKIDRGLDRARRRLVFVDELRQDGRHAVRQLFRSPGFALTAIVTLALGIGATAPVFSLVNALLLRPYPYRAADRIVNVFGVDERTGQRRFLSYPDLIDFGEQNDVLGVDPLLGRTFRPGEDGPGADRVVILSERFWRSTLDADPDAVGSPIVIDAEPHVVIGVVPRGAAYPDEADLWVTLRLDPQQQARGSHWVNSVGRLKPGVSAEQARAGLDVIARRLEQQYPDSNTGSGVAVEPLRDVRSEDNRAILAVLLGAVGFVLLIACANVSGLLLARATARATEMSLRAALGAGRGRLVRQLMTEVALLVVPGAVLGLGISLWVTSQAAVWAPGQIPDWIVLDLDVRMTLFIVAASVVTTLMCGLAPAMQATKVDLAGSIKESGAGASGGARIRRLRSALVVAEVALSIALLVGAGLMIKSFVQLTRVSPGFETDRAFMMTTAFAASTYATAEQRVDFYDRVRDRLIALPGVQAVGGVARPPLRGGWSTVSFTVEGQTADEQRDNPPMLWHTATSGYLGAAGVPLLRGRDFSAADIDGPRGVVLVTRQMVDRYWPDADPIGRRVKFGQPAGDSEWMDVVGVVGGVKQIDMLADEGLQWYTHMAARGRRRAGSPGSCALMAIYAVSFQPPARQSARSMPTRPFTT